MPVAPSTMEAPAGPMDQPNWMPPAPPGVDLRAAARDAIRDLIRTDPALWERVQADPELRRTFGFE